MTNIKPVHSDVDLLILGGGINGCAIAADAAQRGLRVAVVEKQDLAGGTSWTSTKLIHGGLRYLGQGHIHLVRKALIERTRLFNNAPHLVQPIALNLISQENWLQRQFIRAGLWLYDHLDLNNPFPHSKQLQLQNKYKDVLQSHYHHGFQFYDARTDDTRLTILNAKQAAAHGAQIYNYCELTQARLQDHHWQISCQTKDIQLSFKSKLLINATGPWINEVNQQLGLPSPLNIALVKGSHIICPNHQQVEEGFVLPTTDQRIIFVLPYMKKYLLIGTTEQQVEKPNYHLKISEEEKHYLLDAYNTFFKQTLHTKDILFSFSGIRPLVYQGKTQNPSEISRDYEIHTDFKQNQIIHIYGGKITTHRQLAEECIDCISQHLSCNSSKNTRDVALPGKIQDHPTMHQKLLKTYPQLSSSTIQRLLEDYGEDAVTMLQEAENQFTEISHQLYSFELNYLKKHEWLKTVDDFIWKRTKFGLQLSPEDLCKLQHFF